MISYQSLIKPIIVCKSDLSNLPLGIFCVMDCFDLELCTEEGFFFKCLYVGINNSNQGNLPLLKFDCIMEDGDVDRTVIDCWQNQLGQMADFPPLNFFNV